MAEHDLVIRGATVIDGTGAPRRRASVAVAGGRIAALEASEKARGARSIDAGGLVLTPGFIDTHSHSDLRILDEPDLPMKVRQGVTLEVFGQDGISVAPLRPEWQKDEERKLAGLLGRTSGKWEWSTVAEYLSAVERRAPVPNVSTLVPHGAVRTCVIGPDDRAPTKDELAKMGELLDRCLTEGAIGLSTGLIYPPCCYAKTDELIALGRVLAKHGGPFVVHLRSESDRILEAIDEMVHVCRTSGSRLHISHWKIAGKENYARVAEVIAKVDEARASGVTVTCDQYPYAAGSTMLGAILPPWAHDGGPEATIARLRDPAQRARMKAQMSDPRLCEWDNFWRWTGPSGIVISDVASGGRPELLGKSIAEAAGAKDALDFALDLLRDEAMGVGMVSHNQHEPVVEKLFARPYVNICTDGLLGGRPHPRAYGAYPRVVALMVRERKAVSLEEAVRKMTSQAAAAMNVTGVGTVAAGQRADLVLFDEAKLRDRATYDEPTRVPEGLETVIVGGKVVLEKGAPLGRVGGGTVVRLGRDRRV
jgi:N-acyl-D-amino-acid deacylase